MCTLSSPSTGRVCRAQDIFSTHCTSEDALELLAGPELLQNRWSLLQSLGGFIPRIKLFFSTGTVVQLIHCTNDFLFIIICFGICLLTSQKLRGGGHRQFLLNGSHQWKGITRAGVLSSQDPSWVLLPGLLPIHVSGHGWRFINSVLLLEFLCCANLLLSDHFQQIFLASHVKLLQTLTNQGKPFIKLPDETIYCFYCHLNTNGFSWI